jgi:DNA-binding CsgD family transcriptional regulator
VAISEQTLDEALHLVGLLYRHAIDSSVAGEPLNHLSALLGSRGAQMYTYDRTSGQVIEASSDDNEHNKQANQLYVEHWGNHDPRPALSAKQASGSVLRCHDHFTDSFVAHSPFYQEFFIPNGYRWALGGMLHNVDGTSTVIASVRAPDQGRYEQWTQRLLSSLLPHFQEAALLRRKLAEKAAQQPDFWRLIEHLPSPAFLMDGRSELLLMNPSAGPAIHEMPVTLAGRFIRFNRSDEHAQWLQLLAQSRSSDGVPRCLVVQSQPNVTWKLGIVPLRYLVTRSDAADEGLCVVFAERIGGPSARQIQEFARSTGLSAAEAEVLSLLLGGFAPKSIARERGSSINTVRTQIASVLSKSGCSTQRELFARLQVHSL